MVKILSKVRNREAFCCALLAQLISPYLNWCWSITEWTGNNYNIYLDELGKGFTDFRTI